VSRPTGDGNDSEIDRVCAFQDQFKIVMLLKTLRIESGMGVKELSSNLASGIMHEAIPGLVDFETRSRVCTPETPFSRKLGL
jgi:hypothetical protein